LGGNTISRIPVSLGELKNLKTFYVAHNHIKAVPDSIGQLEKLAKMDLRDNQITQLPASLHNLKNLNDLKVLKGNPISELPRELTEQVRWVS
jgi:Leucine-rich repeat (LRR) protein